MRLYYGEEGTRRMAVSFPKQWLRNHPTCVAGGFCYIPCQLFYAVKSFCLHHSHHIDFGQKKIIPDKKFSGRGAMRAFFGV
jgi:hypothetical protein